MATQWTKHDDSTYMVTLGGVLLVVIVYDQVGTPGWKIQVGKRSLRDKLPTQEDAQKVALAYANRILNQCRKELDEMLSDATGKETS